MWQKAGGLFKREKGALDETDKRMFAQQYLRQLFKTKRLYCDEVKGGRVKVRVGLPELVQEVRLAQYDLARALEGEVGFKLTELVVTQL